MHSPWPRSSVSTMQVETQTTAGQSSVFETARLSEAGGRASNEDFCGFLQIDNFSCWVLVDGLGAHRGGEIASRAATETVLESFRLKPEISPAALESYIAAAHEGL